MIKTHLLLPLLIALAASAASQNSAGPDAIQFDAHDIANGTADSSFVTRSNINAQPAITFELALRKYGKAAKPWCGFDATVGNKKAIFHAVGGVAECTEDFEANTTALTLHLTHPARLDTPAGSFEVQMLCGHQPKYFVCLDDNSPSFVSFFFESLMSFDSAYARFLKIAGGDSPPTPAAVSPTSE